MLSHTWQGFLLFWGWMMSNYICIPYFFSHSSVDGHLGCFYIFYCVTIVAWSIYERNKTPSLHGWPKKKKSRYFPNPYNNALVPPQPGPQGPLSQKSWNSYSQQLHEYLFHMMSSIHFSSLNTVALFVSPFTIQVNGSWSGLKVTFWWCELDLSISSSSLSPGLRTAGNAGAFPGVCLSNKNQVFPVHRGFGKRIWRSLIIIGSNNFYIKIWLI